MGASPLTVANVRLWPKAAVQNVGVETERQAVADEAFGKLAIKIGSQRFTNVVLFQNGPSVLSRLEAVQEQLTVVS